MWSVHGNVCHETINYEYVVRCGALVFRRCYIKIPPPPLTTDVIIMGTLSSISKSNPRIAHEG